MDGPKDEIVFIAKNKEWRDGIRLEITDDTKKEEIAAVLFKVAEQCYDHLFDHAGIKSTKVQRVAREIAKEAEDLQGAARLRPTKIKKAVVEYCESPAHYKLAESLFNKEFLQELGYEFIPKTQIEAKRYKTETREYEEIIFIAKHEEWIMIKKLLIDPKLTKQEEVSLILASIYNTIVDKAFEYLGVDVERIEEECAEDCKGLKKGFGPITEAMRKGDDAATIYYNRKVCENAGKKLMFENELLQKVYPDLKIPKPRGNYGGKKKKKKKK